MSEYTTEIYKFLDNKMSVEEIDEFLIKVSHNKELKDDYLMIQRLNEHMKYKELTESFEKDVDYININKEAKEDVKDLLVNGKKDELVLSYLSTAYPENDSSVKNKIIDAEEELRTFENNEEFEMSDEKLFLHEEKDPVILKLIQQSSSKKENKNKISVSSKPSRKFNISIDKRIKRILYIASSVAAICFFMLLINNVFNKTSVSDKIIAKFHDQPFKLEGIQMRDHVKDTDIKFEEAVNLYKQSMFDDAYLHFQSLVSEDPDFVQALFYSGLSQFESNKYGASAEIFTEVISDFDEYNIEAKWFLSLAFIKMNKFDKAVPYLQEISEQKSIYQTDAAEILELIKD